MTAPRDSRVCSRRHCVCGTPAPELPPSDNVSWRFGSGENAVSNKDYCYNHCCVGLSPLPSLVVTHNFSSLRAGRRLRRGSSLRPGGKQTREARRAGALPSEPPPVPLPPVVPGPFPAGSSAASPARPVHTKPLCINEC